MTRNTPVWGAMDEHRIIRRLDEDPDEESLKGGAMWFRTDLGEWRGYDGTDFVTFTVTVDQ